MDHRAGEDPVSILFSSLEKLAKNAPKLDKKIMRSFYLLLIWLAFAFFLWISAVINLTLFDIISYALLITIIFLVMIYLVDMREKLAMVISRYQAYSYLQNSDDAVPDGKNEVERFMNYLEKNMNFSKRVLNRHGKILRNVNMDEVHFEVYVEIKRNPLLNISGMKNYSFYLLSLQEPKIDELKKVINVATTNSKKHRLEMGRIVILAKKLNDESYKFIVSDRNTVPVQVVIEMEDGTYDFIPFIGPRSDLLP